MGNFRLYTEVKPGVFKQLDRIVFLNLFFDGIVTVSKPEKLLKNIPQNKILEYGILNIYKEYTLDDFIKYEEGFSELAIILKGDSYFYTQTILLGNNKSNRFISYWIGDLMHGNNNNCSIENIKSFWVKTSYAYKNIVL